MNLTEPSAREGRSVFSFSPTDGGYSGSERLEGWESFKSLRVVFGTSRELAAEALPAGPSVFGVCPADRSGLETAAVVEVTGGPFFFAMPQDSSWAYPASTPKNFLGVLPQ